MRGRACTRLAAAGADVSVWQPAGSCGGAEAALAVGEVEGDGGPDSSSGSVSPACATSQRRRAAYWPTRAARLRRQSGGAAAARRLLDM
jgi:hypothetical protein